MSNRKPRSQAVFLGVILLLILVMIGSLAQIVRYTIWGNDAGEQDAASKTVIKNGVAYFPRQDITVVMVAGIDQQGKVQASGSYNNHGAADMIMLLILDDANEKYDVLYLNRDTMMPVPVLGIGGKPAGTYFGQLALAHTYGTGLEDSCENTRKAVSDFLMGVRIDYYMVMNMDAVSILADAVGGVTVNVEEDFSSVDPAIPMGTVTLKGEQALNYVRTRKAVGDQLNLSRIDRQKKFMNGFVDAFREAGGSDTKFFASTYDAVAEYLVTDCSVKTVNNLYQRYSEYTLGQIYTPEGENIKGEKYYEFYADEEKLEDLTLQLFYAPKK